MVLMIEPKVLGMLGKGSTTWVLSNFLKEEWVDRAFCPGLQTLLTKFNVI
jgi:hypothetical protein